MLRPSRLIAAISVVIAIAATGCGGSDEETQVSAYPSPGTPAASPQTGITLVGLDPDDPGEVK